MLRAAWSQLTLIDSLGSPSSPLALGALFAATPATAKPKAAPITLDLPVQSFTLENGLRVFVVEDHSTPALALTLFYDVGAADEVPGKTGLAHFFEHMMFMGSETLPRCAVMENTKNAGGDANAFTTADITVYLHTIPSNYLDMVLWGEADRLGALTMTEELFEVQRAAVISEKDRQGNQAFAQIVQRQYVPELTPGSPYTHEVIGTDEDLAAMNLGDAQRFFDQYYTPQNAIMVLVGDLDFENARARDPLLQRHPTRFATTL
ncbi:MAG: M16 family metallopeptidase [Nannocystaceae bacterium]